MTLRFAYKLVTTRRPVVSLGGRHARPRPLVNVAVIGPSGTNVGPALLDVGADDTIFPDDVA